MIDTHATTFIHRALLSMACAMLMGAQSTDLDIAAAKGIYRDGGNAAANTTGSSNRQSVGRAIRYDLLLQQGAEWVNVGPNYHFRNGDKFKFRLQSNHDGYVYLLNRTFNGDNVEELAAKGIQRVRVEDRDRRPEGSTYRLIYPLRNDANKLKANSWVVLPGSDAFSMDDRPGVEKLYIIVSSKPIRWDDRFDVASGEVRRQTASSSTSNRSRNDSDEDVLSQLNKELETYAANGQSATLQEKGIIRQGSDSESYGVVRDSSKPAQFEVSLRHMSR